MAINTTKSLCIALLAVIFFQESVMSADFVIDTSLSDHDFRNITLSGEIKPGDDVVFSQMVKNAKQVWLNLNSLGGDIDTAMAIGAIVRKKEGTVLASACYSSCVLIFAGGVTRGGPGVFGTPVVGVHRMFFSKLRPELSASQVKTEYDSQLKRIRNYLTEMNVLSELLTLMQSIQPEDIHILTREELNRYGLGAQDVIYSERQVAARAEELGISSLEYRSREQRGRDECKNSAAMMQPTDLERSEAKRMDLPIDYVLSSTCALAIHYGISVATYRQRASVVGEKCHHFTEQSKQNRCQVHYMATGNAAP